MTFDVIHLFSSCPINWNLSNAHRVKSCQFPETLSSLIHPFSGSMIWFLFWPFHSVPILNDKFSSYSGTSVRLPFPDSQFGCTQTRNQSRINSQHFFSCMEDDNDSLGASVLFEASSQELDPTIQTYGQWLDESPMLLALLWTFHIQIWFLDGSFIGV